MIRKKRFEYGGVTEYERPPFISESIQNAYLPLYSVLLLKEAANMNEAIPVVSIGQEVTEGQLLARGNGKGSANVFSPIPGIVRRIENIKTSKNYSCGSIVVSLEGSFSMLGRKSERYLWKSLNKADMLHIVQEKGLVQISTGEPLYDVLISKKKSNVTTLIINALEMDSYRHVESEILIQRTENVIDGITILSRILEPKNVILAVPEEFPSESITKINTILSSSELKLNIEYFKQVYPEDMPNMIASALGSECSKDYLSIEVSTVLNLHEALLSNKPQIEQYVQVAGNSLKKPAILKARIGAPIGDLIEECGGLVGKPDKIVLDNPFTGFEAIDLDTPVTKTTRAVLALSKNETKNSVCRPCNRCGKCLGVCPIKLNPYRLMKLVKAGFYEKATEEGLLRCTMCGSCAYVCMSRIPLVNIFYTALAEGNENASK